MICRQVINILESSTIAIPKGLEFLDFLPLFGSLVCWFYILGLVRLFVDYFRFLFVVEELISSSFGFFWLAHGCSLVCFRFLSFWGLLFQPS